jgi:iron(III) transport system permease protein
VLRYVGISPSHSTPSGPIDFYFKTAASSKSTLITLRSKVGTRLQAGAGRPPLGGLGCFALLVALLITIPVASVVLNLFRPSTDTWSHMAATVLPEYAFTTCVLAVGVAIGVILLGVGAAWLVVTYRFPGRDFLQWALVLPLAMPAYVIAYAYTDWLQFTGPVQTALREAMGWRANDYWLPDVRSLPAAIVIFSFVLYPYVYLLVRTALIEQSASAIEAARLMGLSRIAAFYKVGIPLARPAIAAGVALALMETLADFGAVSYFGVQSLTTGIFRAWQSFGDQSAAAQLSVLLLIFVAVIIAIERMNRGGARFQGSSTIRRIAPHTLRGTRGLIASVLCTLPFALGFALPALLLAKLALGADEGLSLERLARTVGNSVFLAALTALLAVGVALLLGYAERLSKHSIVRSGNRVVGLGYAMPGAVVAVGILVPMAAFDNLIANWVHSVTGMQVGLIITGSLIALVYAYLVRFLAIALQTVDSGLTRITPSMDDAARSLGYTPREAVARVHLPMLRPTVLTAALLVFVDVMKELPATFALRPFNFDTLAIQIFHLAKDERLAEAALPSLVLVLVGLVPLGLIARRLSRGRDATSN